MEELFTKNEEKEENSGSLLNKAAILLALMIGLTFGSLEKEVSLKSRTTVTQSFSIRTEDSQETDTAAALHGNGSTGEYYPMYKTPTGRKYHFNPSCAGKNSVETDYDEALSLGLTPCKKCADG